MTTKKEEPAVKWSYQKDGNDKVVSISGRCGGIIFDITRLSEDDVDVDLWNRHTGNRVRMSMEEFSDSSRVINELLWIMYGQKTPEEIIEKYRSPNKWLRGEEKKE